jgi:hypothetical protein
VRLLALLLLGLLLAYVVLDFAAKGFVEARVEDEFRDGNRLQVEEASFSIDSFPFLIRLGAFGEVDASLHLEGIQEQGVAIDGFDLEVDGLVYDRTSAFNGDVRVNGLERATTSITLSEGTIGELVGVPVDISADGTVTVGDLSVQAEMISGGLALGSTAVPVRLARFLPCDPDLALADDTVTLTCVTDELPPIVNRVLGEAADEVRD